MRQSRKQLRQVTSVRVVGFMDAVRDLGTHTIYGNEVGYSRQHVYNVLKGKMKSDELLKRIVEKRPDLLGLHFVDVKVREAGEKMALALNGEGSGQEVEA